METSGLQVLFSSEGVEPGALRPTSLLSTERLSRISRTDVALSFDGGDGDPVGLLRKFASVVVLRADGSLLRRFDGLVTAVRERVKASSGKQQLSVTLESPLALLRHSSDYRIFQEQSSQDIANQVLQTLGLAELVEWRVTPPPVREVCTQYSETAFEFVERILQEDGICYFWQPGEEGAKVVFADSNSEFEPGLGAPLRYVSALNLNATEYVHHLSDRSRCRVGRLTLRDHDFKRPSLDMEAVAENEAALNREHYEFPGRYVEPAEGSRRAAAWLEATVAEAQGVVARGAALMLSAGHRVTLTDCVDPNLDGEYVIRGATHRWAHAPGDFQHQTELDLLPMSVPYRPERRASPPRAVGPTLAVVTGPAGEEIHCDEYGRIKVQFLWDRYGQSDDKSSAWVRVAQVHSSGSVVIPRVGWEVLVDFEDGDPDKPIVLGRVYNGKFPPPANLPGEKTTSAFSSFSSPGGAGKNEIKMDDGAGAEVYAVNAQKDMNICIANDKTVDITNHDSLGVTGDQAITVGGNETVTIGGNRGNNVGGNQSWSVGASRTKTVSGSDSLTVNGTRSTSIGASHTTMTPMMVSVSTPQSLTETVGGSCLEAAGLGVSIAALGTMSICVGGAKIEACAAGKADITLGARSASVGGALINAAGKDTGVTAKGAKATNVGGVWLCAAGGKSSITAKSSLTINVGGAFAALGSTVVLEVGGSSVTLSGGAAVLKSSSIELAASGPNAEVAGGISSK